MKRKEEEEKNGEIEIRPTDRMMRWSPLSKRKVFAADGWNEMLGGRVPA